MASKTSKGTRGGVRLERMLGVDAESTALRNDCFKMMDGNGNGLLSLAEIDKFVSDVWPELDNAAATMRAYKAADTDQSGLIGAKEFHFLLKYLLFFDKQHTMFHEFDTSKDGRIDEAEFVAGAAKICPGAFADATKAFRAIDLNGGGYILFTEFCVAIARQMFVTDAVDEELYNHVYASTKDVIDDADSSKLKAGEWYKGRQNLLALAKKTPEAAKQRKALFTKLDKSGDGEITFDEVRQAVRDMWPEFDNEDACKFAFSAADRTGDGQICQKELRLLVKYLVFADDTWDAFKQMDTDADGQLSLKEFTRGLHLCGVKQVANPELVFRTMDADNSGDISLNEFMLWLAEKKAKQDDDIASDFKHGTSTDALDKVVMEAQAPSTPIRAPAGSTRTGTPARTGTKPSAAAAKVVADMSASQQREVRDLLNTMSLE